MYNKFVNNCNAIQKVEKEKEILGNILTRIITTKSLYKDVKEIKYKY